MKIICLLVATLAVLSVPVTGSAQVPGSVSSMVMALKFTYTIPGTVLKDENGKVIKGEEGGPTYSNEWQLSNEVKMTEEHYYEYVSKTASAKYGNKEFLLDLIDAGILPEYGQAPYIAGWSIVLVNATFEFEDESVESGDSKFYAVHKTEGDIIDLSDVIQPNGDGAFAESGSYKDVYKGNFSNPEAPKESRVISSSFNWRENTQLFIDFEGFSEGVNEETLFAGLQGIFTQSDKRVELGPDKIPVLVNGAGKLASISGVGPYIGEESFDRSVAEGTVNFTAGKATEDVSEYPNLVEMIDF